MEKFDIYVEDISRNIMIKAMMMRITDGIIIGKDSCEISFFFPPRASVICGCTGNARGLN